MGQQNQDQQSRNPNEPPAEGSREEVRSREDIDRDDIDIESETDDDLDDVAGSE